MFSTSITIATCTPKSSTRAIPTDQCASSTICPRATRLTEIHMSQAGYDYIRARSLYNTAGQLRAVSSGEAVSFPAATKEVKAKWRVISEAERGRYYTMTVKLADGTERLYGLTAL